MIRIKCPKCKTVLSLDDSLAGKVAACAECSTKLKVPAAKAPIAAPLTSPIQARPRSGAALQRKPPAPPPLDELEVVEDDDVRPKKNARSRGQFEPTPYVSDGGLSVYGIPVLLFSVLVGGVFFGWLAAFMGQWAYPVILMPLGVGFGIFGAGWLGVRVGKVRSRPLGAVAGFCGGCVAILALHYASYLQAIFSTPNLAPAEKDALTFSVSGFLAYIDAQATEGVRILSSRGNPANRESNLGYVGSYIYWFGEWLMAAGIGLAGTMLSAGAPFCGSCQRWKKPRLLGSFVATPNVVIDALKTADFERLSECEPAPGEGPLLLTASVCPDCQGDSDIDLKLQEVIASNYGKARKKELVHLTYPAEALPALEAVFQGRAE